MDRKRRWSNRLEILTILIVLVFGVSRADEPRQMDLFRAGEGGYHTYRIPSLIETRQGVLLAFCEGRKSGSSDAGDIDLLLRRSSDGGSTWSPVQTVWDDGPNTCGNPCPVVDRETGTVWLLMTWNAGRQREDQIQPGFGEDSRRVFVTQSSDEGATWEKPVEITRAVKRPEWSWYATGPGNGIQLRGGRLVIPCDHRTLADETPKDHSHVLYSDDHGKNWQIGGIAEDKTNESAVAELKDGTLLLNMRNNYGRSRRAIAKSADGGLNWSPVTFDDTLVEPVCQASLVTTRRWNEAGDELLFSNPADTQRIRMTIRLSRDGGRTWPQSQILYPGPAAYSSLCPLGNNEAAILYERGDQNPYERITFTRFNQDWLAETTRE